MGEHRMAIWAWTLGLSLGPLACGEPTSGDPERVDPHPPDSDGGTTTTGPGTTDADDPQSLDPPGYPAPDCATLLVPGLPSDLAATPRPDHDAEVLALALHPTVAVARQAHYETIAGDLSAIRALDPTLAEVHVGCLVPNGVAFWFFDEEDVNAAIWAGSYHAWDCHHERYGLRQELRIDGAAVAIELDGVYGEAVWQAYGSLPGLDDHHPHWFARDDWPVPTHTGEDCEATAGSIVLQATEDPDGVLVEREYRFEPLDGTAVVYRVLGDGEPAVVG